jgi:hypothetical protein
VPPGRRADPTDVDFTAETPFGGAGRVMKVVFVRIADHEDVDITWNRTRLPVIPGRP